MRRSLTVQHGILTVVSFILFSIVFGCGNGATLETQISGTWNRTQGNGTVDVNLVNEPKSLVIDGHSYKAVIEKIDEGTFTALVKVEIETGKTEVWTLRQVWDDNGSTFKLAFRHNGTEETLVPAS
ncbi:MAG: hypothetical protein JJV98_04395 [Desulfosarcina sp.]|nr:hypothetical protein [Desulfobacterales bacterium]